MSTSSSMHQGQDLYNSNRIHDRLHVCTNYSYWTVTQRGLSTNEEIQALYVLAVPSHALTAPLLRCQVCKTTTQTLLYFMTSQVLSQLSFHFHCLKLLGPSLQLLTFEHYPLTNSDREFVFAISLRMFIKAL